MDTQFFLAANSGRGFVSRYAGFPGEGAFLHILKGGPGTGKSSFLKRIRTEAAAQGLDTESILCSGDPDSLDGLLIPALSLAWADGTAPHVLEPGAFGVDADYVNLGRFCRPLDEAARTRAGELNRAYKARYRDAYALLRAALALDEAGSRPATEAELAAAEETVRRYLDSHPAESGKKGSRELRFLSAISCRGLLRLDATEEMLCKQMLPLPGGPATMERAAVLAEARGLRVICCPRPLNPDELEAVLLPEAGLGFFAPGVESPESGLRDAALRRATEYLREAKRLHDELEAVYRPFVDFTALTAFTEDSLQSLFGEK